MELEHTFTVPVPKAEAFAVLRDIERIGPCMPGATIEEVDGDHFTGRVKVKIGPIQVTYRGEASYVEIDEESGTARIEAKGKETRGAGTASATVTARLEERGAETEVRVVTDLAITGRPAQFGRGVMEDVGDKLIGKFADCLAGKLAGEPEEEERPPEPVPAAATPTTTTPRLPEPPSRAEGEAIDLLDVAGAPVAKRLAPLAAVALLALWWLLRRRRG